MTLLLQVNEVQGLQFKKNESIRHIFFECDLSWQIWSEQSRVLGGCDSGKGVGD
ncbi:S-norcoclaurine synthase 1-like [Iris pallida]|uniref:S-norcoclaurine synthase 1-like n=1 Tax=Iris pallida TaxID=29817 RepID=A0AAX6IFK1_IRIPA|nr:S-norcoclaurine synthase 1-like [Iris pallida]